MTPMNNAVSSIALGVRHLRVDVQLGYADEECKPPTKASAKIRKPSKGRRSVMTRIRVGTP